MNTQPPQQKPIDFSRELQATCQLGYIDLSSAYIKNVIHSSVTDPEFTNDDVQRSPYLQSKISPVSDNLKKAKGSGYIPSVNSQIGATFDTFCVGAIKPNTPHPLLNLIQGPDYQVNWVTELFFNESQINYLQPLSVASISQAENALSVIAPTPQVFNALNPTLEAIPDYQTLFTPNVTYNIWQLNPIYGGQISDNTQDIQLYKGYIPDNINEPTMFSKCDSGSSGQSSVLRVISKNASCLITRMYPLSNDLVYSNFNSNVLLWYTPPHTTTLKYESIKAQGNYNCGFVLKFSNISGSDLIAAGFNSSNTTSNSVYVYSKIGISWGNTTDYSQFLTGINSSTDYIYNFFENYYLEITNIGFSLRGNNIELIKQNTSHAIGKDTNLNVYVHFAGLIMYIGFDDDPSNWYAIKEYPIPQNNLGENQFIYHKMDPTASIAINVMNVDFNFQYGAICFNNHDKAGYKYSIVPDPTGIATIVPSTSYPYDTYPSLSGKPFYSSKFLLQGDVIDDGSGNQIVQLDPIIENDYSEQNINVTMLENVVYLSDHIDIASTYQQGIFPITAFNEIPYSINAVPGVGQTFNTIGGTLYWDYRSTTAPIQYVEESVFDLQARADTFPITYVLNGYEQINGQIFFTNTIEGPVVLRMGKANADDFANTDRPIESFVFPLDWGDITDFFQSAEISAYINPQTLSHRLEKTAQITLKNIHNSSIGASILYLIKNNILTVTIKAGYKNSLYTYFEGVINDITINEGPSEATIILSAKDVLTTLITSPTGFQFPNSMLFRGMEYGKIIKTAFGAVGLDDYLWININDDDVMNASKYRLPFVSEGSNNKLSAITSTKDTYIGEVVDSAMNLIVTQSADPNGRQIINLPVLFWDNSGISTDSSTFGVISMQQRGDSSDNPTSSANGTNLEVLQFLASQDGQLPDLDAINFIGTTLTVGANGVHGLVASSGFSTKSSLQPLAAGMRLVGQKSDSSFFVRYSYAPDAFDTIGINSGPLSSQSNADLITGYVGYNKMLINDPKEPIFRFMDPRILTDDVLTGNLEAYLFHQVRNVLESLSFEVYVTKPLREHGKFQIEFFSNDASTDPFKTDEFFYQTVKYSINKNQSVIIARVDGVNLSYLAGLGFVASNDILSDLDLREYQIEIMKQAQNINTNS